MFHSEKARISGSPRRAEATALRALRAAGVPLLTTSDADNVSFGGA